MDTWPYGYTRDGRRRIPKHHEEGCYESEYETDEDKEVIMGWASGSCLFDDLIKALSKHIPLTSKLILDIAKQFEDYDCDTLDECDSYRLAKKMKKEPNAVIVMRQEK